MAVKKIQLALLVALAIQQFSNPASAQTAAPEPATADATLPEVKVKSSRNLAPTYNPPTAVSATKIEAPLRDIPQTVNVVPQSLLRDQGVRSMQEVLKAVPGIGIALGDGQRDEVTIRGFTAIADQFIDGLRDDALYFRDLSNIEQVEVIKGPASVLYGRGSSGGLINRISKKPGINKNEVSTQVGSWGQRRGEFDLARDDKDSGVAFRVTGALERADSYRDQQFLKREALAPSLSVKLDPDTQLLIQGESLSDRRVTDFGVPAYHGLPVDVPASTYYGAAKAKDFDYSQARVNAFGFTLDHRFDSEWSVRNAFRHYDYSLDRNNTLVSAVVETTQRATLTRSNVKRQEDGYTNQTELTQKTTLAGMPHQLLYGVEIGQQNKDQFRTSAVVGTVSLFNPEPLVVPFTVAPVNLNNLGIFTVASAYAQDLVTLSERWKALVGVRFDKFGQETQERLAGKPSLERTDRAWSPRAGLVYQPSQQQSYYASYSKSFQPSGENFALAANNAQLEPEQTTNHEVGAKFDFLDGRAAATVSLFQAERTNIKAADPATNLLIPIGTQTTNGLELTFNGDLAQGWQVWSGYSYLDARVTSSIAKDDGQFIQGKRAALTPAHSANLWFTKALGHGFGAGAGVNYVGDRFANPGNTVTLPSYVTADLMAYYRMAGLDLQVNLMNIFNRDYIVAGHGASKYLNLPGAPRSLQVTARYNF
ncbi:MAG: TonB-dependent siderophore receptor [Rhodoferax sp.]|uniref:TonB-dependent receptor n=1 Tax=Rhodoferax sp. TaxID=50421 RepID=UPI0018571469|nr:TonB-dependent siderophore receptor [Rhodoferax sp.]NMM14417.1 TonB-dependent siderophore receptor [Rhodoferax sp.]